MKKICVIFTLCLFSLSILAQTWKISGTVTESATSEPLTGVTVKVKNKKSATSTDLDGNYSIEAAKGDVLEFTFLGMESISKNVVSNSPVNVIMQDDNVALDQIVVIGYGAVKKSDLTGAVSSISGKNLQTDVARNAATALQGRVAGVAVTNLSGQPGAGLNINIRGITSLSSTSPLYVIDGVYGDINTIDPSDIASIEVLKDASAAAIYGSRAASGVILITTKSGKRDTPSKLSINVFTGFQNLPKKLEVMNGEQWAGFVSDNGIHPGYSFQGKGTDWQDEIFRTAPITKANIGITGGSKTATYSASIGYLTQDGIIIDSKYDAFNARLKNEFSFLNDRLKIGESIILKSDKQKIQNGPALITQALRMPSTIPVYDDTRFGGWGAVESWMSNVSNPVGDIHANSSWDNNSGRSTHILFNAFAQVEIIKGLQYKLNFGLQKNHGTSDAFRDIFDFGVAGNNKLPDLRKSTSDTDEWLLENTLNYNKTFGKNTIYGLLGYSAEREKNRSFSASRQELPIGVPTLSAGSGDQSVGSSTQAHSTASMFARVMYSYDSRYLFSASIRRDGSSRFAHGHRWGNFPSVSAGWNISNESFAESMKSVFDELKLRVSYGVLGNQNTNNYPTQRTVTSGINYVEGDTWWHGSIPGSRWVSPQDLTWEKNETANIGLDATLFKGKLDFTLDAYIQNNKDILLGVGMPSSSGLAGSPTLNAGTFQNKGLEFSITHRNFVNKVFYSLTANMTFASNKMKKITVGGTKVFNGYNPYGLGTVTKAQVGDPIGGFYLVETDGIFQNQQEIDDYYQGKPNTAGTKPGDIRFIDRNGDGKIDDDDTRLAGNPAPDMAFGFRANVEWNKFDLAMFFDGMVGNQAFNFTRYRMESMITKNNFGKRVLNAWRDDNRNTSIPRYTGDDPNGNSRINSDRWMEEASFLRLKNLEVGYSISQPILHKIRLSNLRIYASCENLFTITPYKGYTPDLGANASTGTNSSSALTRGVDHGRYPLSRNITFGIQIGL